MRKLLSSTAPFLLFALFVILPISCLAQQSPDTRTATFLKQVIDHHSRRADIVRIDAQGTIKYQWAGKEVSGPASLISTRDGKVVLTSSVGNPPRTTRTNQLAGAAIENSKETPITADAGARLECLGFPFAISRLSDLSGAIQLGGDITLGSRRLTAIKLFREQKNRPVATITAYVDSTSLDLIFIEIEPAKGSSATGSRFVFGDLRDVDGALVPFSIAEQVNGQTTWRLQLDSVQINSATTPLNF